MTAAELEVARSLAKNVFQRLSKPRTARRNRLLNASLKNKKSIRISGLDEAERGLNSWDPNSISNMVPQSDLVCLEKPVSTPPKLSFYPLRLDTVSSRRDQLSLEKRDVSLVKKPTNKMLTAHLRAGFLPQWRTEEEDACQLLLHNVVFCSRDMVVFNKPPGLAVQDGAGLRYSMDSIKERLLFLLKKTGRLKAAGKGDDFKSTEMKLVHRLDQDVSGAIVFGLHQDATDFLNSQFKQGLVEKKYWAICVGRPQIASHSGVVCLPIFDHVLADGKSRMRCRFKEPIYLPKAKSTAQVFTPLRDAENIRRSYSKSEAITKYSLLASGIQTCLIELQLMTGKKNQARVHCAEALGCPILGDHKFHHLQKIAPQRLPDEVLEAFGITQPMVRHLPLHLHAKSLVVADMTSGRKVYLNARMPTYFTANMKRLKIYNV